MNNILKQIREERERQDSKWGEQNHGMAYWLAIIMEELGEASECVVKIDLGEGGKSWQEFREEMIQVAAVCVSAIECFDRNNGKVQA